MCAAGGNIQFRRQLSDKLSDRLIEFRLANGVGEYDADELGNAGKQEVRFCGAHGVRFSGSPTERVFKEIDRTLNKGCVS